jgi:RHS repeat-associated protein
LCWLYAGTLRLHEQKAGTASPWTNRQQLTYSYDGNGNVTSLTDARNSGQVQSFGYDWLERLVSAGTNAAGTGQYNHTYAYNAIGNLTSYNGNSYTYGSSKPHAVTAAFGNSYAYDGNGNQITRTIVNGTGGATTYTFVYDYENRLAEVKQGATVLARFLYDASGNRVRGTVDGATTFYIDGIYEYQGGANTRYYAGVAMRRTGYANATDNGIFYILSDQLQSTSRILNRNNTIAATQYYHPFGGNRGGAAFSALTTKRFTGQYHESAIPGGEGLSYYNARWYDSKLGRFTSADTIVPDPANPQDLNRYSYVRNNPLRYVDPSGHEPCANGSMCLPGGPNGYGNASNQSPTFQSTTVKLGYWLLYNEMRPNVQSPVALKIEQLHAESTGLRNLGLVKRSPSLLADAAAMKLEALQLWKSMVQSGAP